MHKQSPQSVIGAYEIGVDGFYRRRSGRGRVDIPQNDAVKNRTVDLEIEL